MNRERKTRQGENSPRIESSRRLQNVLKRFGDGLDVLSSGAERRILLFEADFALSHKGKHSYAVELGGGEIVDYDKLTQGFIEEMEKRGQVKTLPAQAKEGAFEGDTNAARIYSAKDPTKKAHISTIERRLQANKGFASKVFAEIYSRLGIEEDSGKDPPVTKIFPIGHPLTLRYYAELNTEN